jgi:hypothetical protein
VSAIAITDLKPGTVLVVRSPGFPGSLIRLGAALRGKPNLSNHVAIYVKTDARGTRWCLEGRPSGFGWEDARRYLADRNTLANTAQPMDDGQRKLICDQARAMVGTGYDWEAIAADAANDLGFTWEPVWHGQVAGQVVCSAGACYAYDQAKVPRPPGNARTDQPEDWDSWILDKGWAK